MYTCYSNCLAKKGTTWLLMLITPNGTPLNPKWWMLKHNSIKFSTSFQCYRAGWQNGVQYLIIRMSNFRCRNPAFLIFSKFFQENSFFTVTYLKSMVCLTDWQTWLFVWKLYSKDNVSALLISKQGHFFFSSLGCTKLHSYTIATCSVITVILSYTDAAIS